ncbi:hypothetical protein QAD02_002934 [Eretmocerus hayati]|uniref:Uncharacterized protein n=1 Tax=Eretmocerus hayati TaxID=131215 RepID=A0ACC2NKH0_9HYME|nr:hypothetical protein QAD02_002934 [Eretmocerus hayati]
MSQLFGTIQKIEDQVHEEFQRFRNDATFIHNESRVTELQKNVAKLCQILKEALSARDFHGWSTGNIASLEAKLHSATRIASIIRREQAEDRRARIIFFEAESAFKRRYRSAVVGNINHLEPASFFSDAKPRLVDHLSNLIREFRSLKADLTFHAYFTLSNGKRSMKHFRVPYRAFYKTTNVDEWYDQGIKTILDRIYDFNEMESGWALEEIIDIKSNIVKTNPIRGSSFIPTPDFIRKKSAVVNIRCKKNDCFACSIVAGLKPCIKKSSRQNERSSYPTWKHMLINFGDITFPVALEDIPEFERLNPKICVYVYQCDEEHEQVYLVYESENRRKKSSETRKTVRLLLLEKEGKMHYCTIRDPSRLLSSQINRHAHKTYLCDTCQHCFNSEEKLDRHSNDCAALNEQPIRLPEEDEKFLRFTEHYKKEPMPCIIYADLECLLQERNEIGEFSNDSDDEEDCKMSEQSVNNDFLMGECSEELKFNDCYDLEEFRLKKKTHMERAAFRKHFPYSLGYYYLHRYDENKSYYKRHRGRNCVKNFARDLERLARDIEEEIDNPAPLMMTAEDRKNYEATNICHFCDKEITDPLDKVIDHNHRGEGKYRGAAHTICNLHCVDPPVVVVVLHGVCGFRVCGFRVFLQVYYK